MKKSFKENKKVNFFIVGAPKCGTTTLHDSLSKHPSFDFGRTKEPHCFTSDLNLKGNVRLEDYEKGYSFNDYEKTVFGDASVMHLYSQEAAQNIFSYNQKSKIMIMIRDPVGFIQSYHHEQVYNGNETVLDLDKAWRLSLDRKKQRKVPSSCPDGKLLNYKEVALFDVQINRYLELFGPENILLCTLDELKNSPRELYLKILRFVGVDDDGQIVFPSLASAKTYDNKVNKYIVRIITNANFQKLFRLLKKMFGVNQKIGFVKKFRKKHTVSGNKISVPASLRNQISLHYRDSYDAALRLLNELGGKCSGSAENKI